MDRLKKFGYPSLILVVAAVVRFWGWPELHFHHDEISALMRSEFESFSDLIAHGVAPDGHPAGIQWFLWIYTHWFGVNPWVVKLPFIMAGILAVYVVYALGKILFSERAAMVAGALMAVVQYAVVYSQWARPYAFGVLFVLLFTWFLMRYIRSQRYIHLFGWVVFAALSGYTHYFALLQVMVMGTLVVLVLGNRRQLPLYVLGALAATVLWLPHLNLTLNHLRIGGIGDWLQPPAAGYWITWLSLCLQFDFWLAGAAIFLAVVAFVRMQNNRDEWMKRTLLLGGFLVPFAIGFWYSHAVSAVMHEGSLYFAMPFVLLFIGSLAQSLNKQTATNLSLFLLAVGSHNLFVEREHVALNLRTEFMDPPQWVNELRNAPNGTPKVCYTGDIRPEAMDWLTDKAGVDLAGVRPIDPLWERGEWSSFLDTLSADSLVIMANAGSAPEYLSQALWYFPTQVTLRGYQSAEARLLIRSRDQGLLESDTGNSGSLAGIEFGEVSTFELSEGAEPVLLSWYVGFQGSVGNNAQLVMEWKSSCGEGQWRSVRLVDFKQYGWQQIASISTDSRDLPGHDCGGMLRCYAWNPDLDSLMIFNHGIRVGAVNPIRYGLFR